MSTSTELATLEDLLAHARWTRALAFRLLGDADEADDVLQETWLSALRLPPARRRSLRPWLATVVRNLVRSRVRSEARARRRIQQLMSEVESSCVSPEQLMTDRQSEQLIASLVLELPEPYRRTVLLRYHQGKSSVEIAQEEAVAEGTVRWRLKHGLDELRRMLEERAGGPHQAMRVLLPLGVAASAATLTKGAFAAVVPVLLLKGKALVAVATVAVAVSAGLMAENAGPLRSRLGIALLSKRPAPPDRAAAIPGLPAAGPAATALTATAPTATAPTLLEPPANNDVVGASGTFTFKDLPAGKFAITTQVPGRPGSRVVMEVDGVRRGAKVTVSIKPERANARAMAVALEPAAAAEEPADSVDGVVSMPGHSRWCCHRAIAVGQAVEGRACLKLRSDAAAPECEVYGLKRQVRCWDETEGNFATGDLSRTGRLVCEGQAL